MRNRRYIPTLEAADLDEATADPNPAANPANLLCPGKTGTATSATERAGDCNSAFTITDSPEHVGTLALGHAQLVQKPVATPTAIVRMVLGSADLCSNDCVIRYVFKERTRPLAR